MWGDMGRCGEIWARSCGTVRSALTQQYNPGPESNAVGYSRAHLASRGEHLLLAGVASVGEERSRARTGSAPSCEGDAYRKVPGRLVDGSWKGPTPGGEGDASDARAAEALLHPIARRRGSSEPNTTARRACRAHAAGLSWPRRYSAPAPSAGRASRPAASRPRPCPSCANTTGIACRRQRGGKGGRESGRGGEEEAASEPLQTAGC